MAARAEQLVFDFAQVSRPALINFAPGRNSEAIATLHAWLTGLVDERCVFLWGVHGSGKTHLLHASVDAVQDAGRAAIYAMARSVELVEHMQPLPALVAIDDAQSLSSTAQAALFRIFQRAYDEQSRLLIAAQLAPVGLQLRDDLRTRLGAGLIFHINVLSDDEKAEFLRSHARARGFALPDAIVDYLLRHQDRDLRSLMAIVDALDQYSLQTKRQVTLPLLREALKAANR
ncbi:MAG: DnaA regulatory inactivator Hda [Betaproteobacteria bacterium]